MFFYAVDGDRAISVWGCCFYLSQGTLRPVIG